MRVPDELDRGLGVLYERRLAYGAVHDGVTEAAVVDGEDVVAEALPHLVGSNPVGCASVLLRGDTFTHQVSRIIHTSLIRF